MRLFWFEIKQSNKQIRQIFPTKYNLFDVLLPINLSIEHVIV